MRGSRKFCQRGPTFFLCFLVDGGREDPNTTISGPSLAPPANRHENGICWRAHDGPTLSAGLVAL